MVTKLRCHLLHLHAHALVGVARRYLLMMHLNARVRLFSALQNASPLRELGLRSIVVVVVISLVRVLFLAECLVHLIESHVNLAIIVDILSHSPLFLYHLLFFGLLHLLHQLVLIGLLVLLTFVELIFCYVFKLI